MIEHLEDNVTEPTNSGYDIKEYTQITRLILFNKF